MSPRTTRAQWHRIREGQSLSVDRRLFLLVIWQVATAALLICAAVLTLERLGSERNYMDRYVFAPLIDIGEAMETAAQLEDQIARRPTEATASTRGPLLRLQGF